MSARAAPRRNSLLVASALAATTWATCAQAQESSQGIDAPGPRPRVWIEPRITIGQTLSTNGGLSTNARSEQTTEISPGIRAVFNTPRVRGFLDYSLSSLYYAQGTSDNRLRNSLNASATVNAWDNRAFVDVSGVVSDESISAFGPQPVNRLSNVNQSETATFRFSPYLRGQLAGDIDYELRYSLVSSNTESLLRSDITDQVASVRLNQFSPGDTLGWSFNASSQATEYSRGRDTQSDSAQAGLIYGFSPQLRITLLAGVESNDVLTLEPEVYNTAGISADWRPSSNTRVLLGVDERYFGTGHNILLEHRTGRTIWRFSSTRGVITNPLQDGAASRGSVYQLFDDLYRPQFPDDVARAQLISQLLSDLSLPADLLLSENFLSSTPTLDTVQRLSLALVGVRSVWTAALFRSDSSRLNALSNAGDDFALNADIEQQGWSLNYAHRLTPRSSFNAAVSNQKSTGSSGFNTRNTTVSLGLGTRLSRSTSASVQMQRANYSGSSGSFSDTAISGFITHRF